MVKIVKNMKIALFSICIVLLAGCGDAGSDSELKNLDTEKTVKDDSIDEITSEKTADKELVDLEAAEIAMQYDAKYPVGINSGTFAAYKYEQGKEAHGAQVYLYYKDAEHISKRYEGTIIFSYTYDENDKLVFYEKNSMRDGTLNLKGVFEGNKLITTMYDSGVASNLGEVYFDQYGMITQTNDPYYGERKYTYEYEFYDNGNIKSITILEGNSYSYLLSYQDFRGVNGILDGTDGKMEFDENGNKVKNIRQTDYGILTSTWKYDDNGWVIEETHETISNSREIKTTTYIWEYHQLTPDMNIYDEVFGE